MNNNCEFAGGGYCLCSACQSMREMIEYVEGEEFKNELSMSKEEVKKIFEDAEKCLKGCGQSADK